jgi:alpha-D-ribose 1-methylphosphonate 5-triphosphate diphosphatase
VAAAKRYSATLASHDNKTVQQVAISTSLGVTVAEFLTPVETADACHAAGIATIMGAPNLIRGGSHSGNVAAEELATRERLDILSFDYVPAALLRGVLVLADAWQDIPRAIATVTSNPARM